MFLIFLDYYYFLSLQKLHLVHYFYFRKFWTRNRPGDRMRDKYNLNVLPTGFEDDYGKIL